MEARKHRRMKEALAASFLSACASLCHAHAAVDQSSNANAWSEAATASPHAMSPETALMSPIESPPPSPAQSLVPDAASPETASSDSDVAQGARPETKAEAAALADGVTTSLALSAGGTEANPAIAATPLGIAATTGIKLFVLHRAKSMPQEEKRFTLKTTSAVWGGASVNNLLVFLSAAPPVPIIAGVIAGTVMWKHIGKQYEREDRIAAERNNPKPVAAGEPLATLAQADDLLQQSQRPQNFYF